SLHAALPISYLVTLRDVTEQRRQRQQYLDALERERQSREAAEAADRRKDEFLAMLAHELRNPLAPLRNALYMLRQGNGNPAAKAWAWEVVNRQVRQLGRLVDGLLDVSRVTRGRVTLQREAVDLGALARRVAEAARPLFDTKR